VSFLSSFSFFCWPESFGGQQKKKKEKKDDYDKGKDTASLVFFRRRQAGNLGYKDLCGAKLGD